MEFWSNYCQQGGSRKPRINREYVEEMDWDQCEDELLHEHLNSEMMDDMVPWPLAFDEGTARKSRYDIQRYCGVLMCSPGCSRFGGFGLPIFRFE